MLENAVTTTTKKDVMIIGSKAWREGMIAETTNIASGFKSLCLWPLPFPVMQCRLKFFKDSGISLSEANPT